MINMFMAQVGAAADTVHDLDLPTGLIEGRLIGVTPKPLVPDMPEIGSLWVSPRIFPTTIPPQAGCSMNPDADGKFRVEHLNPGWYTVHGYGMADTVFIDRPGAVVTATLQPPASTGEIAGTLAGQITPEVFEYSLITLVAYPKDSQGYDFNNSQHWATVNPKTRRYQFSKLPVGTYGVFVSAYPPSPTTAPTAVQPYSIDCTWTPDVEVRAGMSHNLSIVIPIGRTVRFITADRRPPFGAIPACNDWRLQLPSGDWLPARLIAGTVSLPPGRYMVQAQYGPNGGLVTQEVTVEAGSGEQVINLQAPVPQ
jgi:hypothetical protein